MEVYMNWSKEVSTDKNDFCIMRLEKKKRG